ncbi:hypothetical protein [Enterobacter sp. MALB-1]|uniref:DinB/UmuC family translesion DNA polymerase n=1 Tax=Enterobacter sp. MALB-1 TaxID=3153561 RepID=UPI0034DB560E
MSVSIKRHCSPLKSLTTAMWPRINCAPTQDTRDIIAAATTALARIWKSGHRYAKTGIMLNDFTGAGVSQLQLFDERPPRLHSTDLTKVLNGINHSG